MTLELRFAGKDGYRQPWERQASVITILEIPEGLRADLAAVERAARHVIERGLVVMMRNRITWREIIETGLSTGALVFPAPAPLEGKRA